MLWLFAKLTPPWNWLLLGIMIFPLPFYFIDARRRARLGRKL